MGLLPTFLKRAAPADLARETPDIDTSTTFETQMAAFWDGLRGLGFTPRLIDQVWVANRCLQLNAQQIARMPLRFVGGADTSRDPAWRSSPDPVWFPNGIRDVVFAIVSHYYGWGDAFLYITDRYTDGFPRSFTLIHPGVVTVELDGNGQRKYTVKGKVWDAANVVQITRNPTGGMRGTSALRAYSEQLWGLKASSELGRVFMGEGALPNAVLKSTKPLRADQAAALQAQWVERTAIRRGAPAVLPPEIDFEQLSFSPQDLLLLDAQKWDAQVIATAFGVPAPVLNMALEGGLTYQNPSALMEEWWRTELSATACAIDSGMSAQMLPAGSAVEFDAREALSPTLTDLHKVWIEAFKEGAVTEDEYRLAVLNLDAKDNPDSLQSLEEPVSAGASPAQGPQPPSAIVTLRPQQAVIA